MIASFIVQYRVGKPAAGFGVIGPRCRCFVQVKRKRSSTLADFSIPVSARVVRDGSMSAVQALIAMSTQRSGAATRDGQQHFLMLPADPPAAAFNKRLSGTANDVGHLQRRPVHALCVCSPSPRMVSASSGLPVALR